MEDLAAVNPSSIWSLVWHMFLALPEGWRIGIALLLSALLVIVPYYFQHLRKSSDLQAELERMDDLTDQIGGVLWAVTGGIFANSQGHGTILSPAVEPLPKRFVSCAQHAAQRTA